MFKRDFASLKKEKSRAAASSGTHSPNIFSSGTSSQATSSDHIFSTEMEDFTGENAPLLMGHDNHSTDDDSAPENEFPEIGEHDKTSAQLLTDLAQPKVFEGPMVEVQNEIVTKLEEQLQELFKSTNSVLFNVSCVGGIDLTHALLQQAHSVLDDDFDIGSLTPQLIDLPRGNRAIQKSIFEQVQEAGVGGAIVANTLATMKEAGQIEYLERSGLINDDYQVLVEIHYYRDRDKGARKFHKDTLGQTLFVNLNFVSGQESSGPEFIVNPPESEQYQTHLSDRLPRVFFDDLQAARGNLDEPEEIGRSIIPPNGVVAFVDELIHHKTPTMGHRTVPESKVIEALDDIHARSMWRSVLRFFYKKLGLATDEDEALERLLEKIAYEDDASYNRNDFAHILSEVAIDDLIEKSSEGDFGSASIPRFNGPMPTKKEGRPPFKEADEPGRN